MADYRINLTDGTTTADLYAGVVKIRDGGLSIEPPKLVPQYVTSAHADGDNLITSRYGNRNINLRLMTTGTNLANLKTNIRTVERLLNDAVVYAKHPYRKQGLITSSGKVYLELQWGDSAGQSTFFEVVNGNLLMPDDFYSVMLAQKYRVDCILRLECKPFGLYTAQDIAQATLYNHDDADANHNNYMDIATAEAYGDVPAGLYIKMTQTGATGSKKIWVAKRSGPRYNDDLWIEGEDETSVTNVDYNALTANSDVADANDSSAGNYKRIRLTAQGGGSTITAETVVAYINYDIATPPRGVFRVLARCKIVGDPASFTFDKMGFGAGYLYGGASKAPDWDLGEYYECAAHNTWQILDLGLVYIPPIAESDVATNSTYTLRIYCSPTEAGSVTGSVTIDWIVDYIFLLPIDEGAVIINSVANTDLIALDNISDSGEVFKIDSNSKITGYPSYVGSPFLLGRETTRLYALRDDAITVTFAFDVKYQPRFVTI